MSKHGDIVIRDTNVQTIEWKIKKFFDIPVKCLLSPEFLLSGETWYLSMYQKYNRSSDWLSLYLHKEEESKEIRARYIIGLKKLDGSVFKSFTGEERFGENGFGIHEFIQKSELKKSKGVVAPDGSLTVFFILRYGNGCVKETASQTSQSEFPLDGHASQSSTSVGLETLSRNYKDLFLTGCQGDVKMNVKDREFHAHKLVLTVRSSVFAKMFEHDMAENNNGVVSITDCDPDTFEDFLFYMYSGDLDRVSPNNALSLYMTAEKYDLNDLKKACSLCLTSNFLVDSICDVIQLAMLHDDSELLKTATDYFMDNANAILSTSKWAKFMKEQTSIANELFIKTLNRNCRKK